MSHPKAGEVWEYVGPKDSVPGGRAPGIIVLVLEERASHQELIALAMEPDQHGWGPGVRGSRWTVAEKYGWRRVA